MEDRFQAILETLPPPRARSKLEPYAALIRALRVRGRSYRDIVAILRERCGLCVGTRAPSSSLVEIAPDLQARLAAVKVRRPLAPVAPKEFAFNEQEPLRLITPSKKS